MINIFKVSQVVIIILFAYFVSDLRKKNKTKELLNHNLIILMKMIYMIPLTIFLFSVIKFDRLLFADFISLLLTFLGLIVVVLAKVSLGKNHSWTGYGTYPESICNNGIFSFIRHPMYTGIFLCIFGMWFHVVSHLGIVLVVINILSSLFILFVLYSSSKKEEQHLIDLFEEEYEEYRTFVPPFLPFRKLKKYQD